jgi:hypothetical protein
MVVVVMLAHMAVVPQVLELQILVVVAALATAQFRVVVLAAQA